jgi:TPR repeat protein
MPKSITMIPTDLLVAAQHGNVLAQSNLGYIYMATSTSTRRRHFGVHWLRLAAVKGEVTAKFNLGVHALNKWAGKQLSLNESIRWLRSACRQGDSQAECNYGFVCEMGLGKLPNPKKAYNHYLRSAKNGDYLGIWNVARCNYLGIGCKQNRVIAQSLFSKIKRQLMKLARRGCPHAQIAIAKCFMNGWGFRENRSRAGYWYKIVSGNKAKGAKPRKV